MTHAFFKALLFLGAGSVIHGMGGEQDLRKMGGLRHQMPWTFRTFLVGSLALAGIPPLAGFFSKDAILWGVWMREGYGPFLWAGGVVTAGLTAFYTFRLVVLAFFGAPRQTGSEAAHAHESPPTILLPLVVLAILSAVAGALGIPAVLGGDNRIERFLEPVVGAAAAPDTASHAAELLLMGASVAAGLAGLVLAWFFYGKPAGLPERLAGTLPGVHRLLAGKYYVDEIYNAVIVNPLVRVSRGFLWRGIDAGLIEGIVNGVGVVLGNLAGGLRHIQSGHVRTYAGWILAGCALIVAWLLG